MPISDLGKPNSYSFSCQKCERTQSPRRMAEQEGKCRKCGHDRWLLELEFQPESGTAETLASLGIAVALSGLTQGIVLPKEQERYEAARMSFRDVPAQHAMEICGGSNLGRRLLKYTEYRLEKDAAAHRERIKSRGGECPECGSVYVRDPNKEWTLHGYCSRLCRARGERAESFDPTAPAEIKPLESAPRRTKAPPLEIQCQACGRGFTAPAIYRGTPRPCPHCGEKTLAD